MHDFDSNMLFTNFQWVKLGEKSMEIIQFQWKFENFFEKIGLLVFQKT